jgi:hypothetical protein
MCSCEVQHKIFYSAAEVILKASGKHDSASHSQNRSSTLTVQQKAALRKAAKCAPNESARQLARNTQHFSPKSRIPRDVDALRCAQRVVSVQRRSLALEQTGGVHLEKSSGAMTLLGETMDLMTLILRHNDPADDYHLDLHQMVCIGNQWSRGVTFMELTTPHFIFNFARAIASGWELQIQADESYDFCSSELGVIVLGVNSLRGIFRPVSWSLVRNESLDAFGYAYNGIRASVFSLLKPGALRMCLHGEACEFCEQVHNLQQSQHVGNVLKDPRQRLPVKKAGADNTTKWSKFANAQLA